MNSQGIFNKFWALVAFLFFTPFLLQGQYFEGYSDGPYFFYKKKDIIVRWVESGKAYKQKFSAEDLDMGEIEMIKPFNIPLEVLRKRPDKEDREPFEFDGVKKIAAISDIHGQHKCRSL